MLVRAIILVLVAIEAARMNEVAVQAAPIIICVAALSIVDVIIDLIKKGR